MGARAEKILLDGGVEKTKVEKTKVAIDHVKIGVTEIRFHYQYAVLIKYV